jgi:D-methionine transport system substrate-binding protein
MKKIQYLAFGALAAVLAISSCGASNTIDDDTLVVGADSTPHSLILEQTRSAIEEAGYKLEIVTLGDWTQYNPKTISGEFDANYFQHDVYLQGYLKETDQTGVLTSVAKIHYEYFGIYKGTKTSLDGLQGGDSIILPLDSSNQDRALKLLAANDLVTLPDDPGDDGLYSTDEVESPYVLTLISAELLAANLSSAAIGVINCNYALVAFGDTLKDRLITAEVADETTKSDYGNEIVVRSENADKPIIETLVDALTSDTIREYIENSLGGVVVPLF